MKKLWGQFWCTHRWHKKSEIAFDLFRGYLYPYYCDTCDKYILRWSIQNDPISGILPENIWDKCKKDPLYNMSPPMFRIDD